MSKSTDRPESTHQAVEFVLRPIVGLAFRSADRVGPLLQQLGFGRPLKPGSKPVGAPRAFVEELAAILQVAEWEFAGQIELIPGEWPDAAEAYLALLKRFMHEPEGFFEYRPSPLAIQVMAAWLNHGAWHSYTELGAPSVVLPSDEEIVLGQLADFLFAHRHLAGTLARGTEDEQAA